MPRATRKELETEIAQLRGALDGLDKVLAAIEGLSDFSANVLVKIVAEFEDDKNTQARVALIVADLAQAWASIANDMADAVTSTQH